MSDRRITSLLAVWMALAPTGIAQEVYTEADSITFSETLNIGAILDGLEDGQFRDGGQTSFTHNLGAVGVRWKGFDIAAIARFDYVADYNSDTIALLIGADNGFELSDGDFDVDLRVNRAAAFGARLGYQKSLFRDRVTLSAFSSLLATSALQDGSLTGNLTLSDDQNDIEGALELDYVFSNDIIFDNEVDAPNGFGISFDLRAEARLTQNLTARIDIGDIWSRIWWDDAPGTVATASTSNVTTNPDGTISVSPFLSGQNFTEDTTTRYFARTHAELTWTATDRWTFSQDVFNIRSATLLTSRAHYRVFDDLSLSFEVEWATRGVGFGFAWRGLHARFATDNFDLDDARYLRANLGYSLKF